MIDNQMVNGNELLYLLPLTTERNYWDDIAMEIDWQLAIENNISRFPSHFVKATDDFPKDTSI